MGTATAGPDVGQAVRVRNRLATVRAVEPYDSRDVQGRLNLVEVEYLDDCRYPETDQILREVEGAGKEVLGEDLPAKRRSAPARQPGSPPGLCERSPMDPAQPAA